MILLIDNYDSFVHNLARYLRQLGQETRVVRNDQISIDVALELAPQAIVLSPGPCAPQQAGICLELVRQAYERIPLLGICLGHQAIAEALGGRVVRANEPVHGRASFIRHTNRGVFAGLPDKLQVARYHSLVVTDLPDSLQVDAWLEDGTPMAISHPTYPVAGWQFHPESILTQYGYELLSAFLRLAGVPDEQRADQQVRRQEFNAEKNRLQEDWFRRAIEFPSTSGSGQ